MFKSILKNVLILIIPASLAGFTAWHFSSQIEPVYRADVSLLVIQQQDSYDPSVAARSAERIVETLTKVVNTEAFMNEVASSDFSLPESISKQNPNRRKNWQSMIKATSAGNFLQLQVFHPQPRTAQVVASAAAFVLVTKTNQWHGGGETVLIKVVNAPLTSPGPVRPHIEVNTAASAAAVFLLSCAWLWYRRFFASVNDKQASVANINNSGKELTVVKTPVYLSGGKPASLALGAGAKERGSPAVEASLSARLAEANIRLAEYAEMVYTKSTGLLDKKNSPTVKKSLRRAASLDKQADSHKVFDNGFLSPNYLTSQKTSENNFRLERAVLEQSEPEPYI